MAGLCFCFRSDRGRLSRLLFFSSLSLLLFVFFLCSDGMEREACVCDHGFERSDLCAEIMGACHYLTNRFQMEAPVAPSRSLREAFKRAPRSLRGACLREGFAEPPRRHHEPFAEVYEPFAEVAHTKGSTKTPWRVHEASSKGPWMNCMFLLDHDCNRVWSILYCF